MVSALPAFNALTGALAPRSPEFVPAPVKRMRKSILTVGVLLGFCRYALALDPALDVSQYAHTAWRTQEGFARGEILSIAQTPDGYLWLGTELELFRFDGIRAVAWRPPPGGSLPDTHIRTLLGARDGTLWIGTFAGLASWKGDRFTLYPQLKGWFINALLEDRQGTVWASATAATAPFARLCAISGDDIRCEGDDGRFGQSVTSLHETARGDLWVQAATGVWHWRPGAPKLEWVSTSLRAGLQDIADDEAGGVLIITQAGITRLVDEKTAVPFAAFPDFHLYGLLFRDHNGSVWVGTFGSGLLHLHDGRTDTFGKPDGLSGETIREIFEDREGNIWVATTGGLDRFHDVAAPMYSVAQGLSNPGVASVLGARDGSIWISTLDGLDHWSGGEMTHYSGVEDPPRGPLPRAGPASGVRQIVVRGLPGGGASLFEDRQGRLWVASLAGVGYLENNRYTAIQGIAAGRLVDAMTEDAAGDLWIAHDTLGLVRISPDQKIQTYAWQQLGLQSVISRLAVDPKGGLWLGPRASNVAHFVDGHIRETFSAADGLAKGRIYSLRMDPVGTLWVGAEGGLSRIKSGRIATLDSSSGLPCDSVDWMIDDDAGAVWIDTACGMARIARSELDSWASAVDQGGRGLKVNAAVFDDSDGVRREGNVGTYSPHVAKSRDGRLWFATRGGVGMVNPAHLPRNTLPPAVHIEDAIADRKSYETSSAQRLPPLVRDLQLSYTALSLVAPEKNQFRYKLEGHDLDWQNVGKRRQAFFNDLAPGKYRFRVIASNNNGVWNEVGATLDFSIAPAYWQTTWFRAACVAAFLMLLWALYQLRLRQIAQAFNTRLEERLAERTRIARDLHDTLLQNFQGLLLRFQTVLALCETRPAEAKDVLRSSIDQTAQAITEGREAVQGLRASTVESNDLAQAITTLGEELEAEASSATSVGLHVEVEGTPRNLHAIVRDEIYRIASEALRNAFRHAGAQQIEVEFRYDERQLQLRVRDDGKGIDATFLAAEGRTGHFGLHGMRERAKLMGGKLTVWTAAQSGTEIELILPAARAYAASPRRSWFAEKFSWKSVRSKS
jgi:signal transduction histidine kinase/ligand-binding sensor domain-containing protein